MIPIDRNHKNDIAIIVVGYSRLTGLKRLLESLLAAEYLDLKVPLVISIDASGCEELYEYVRSFEWPYGDKYVNIEEVRLGLKKHLFKCIALSERFKAVIVLEDDLYVSRHFYDYALATVDKYGENGQIAEISLYKNEMNGYVGLPLATINNGYDCLLMQDVGTWGEIFTEQMWKSFQEWYSENGDRNFEDVDMPDIIKGWTRAWSKPYNAYVVSMNKYVVYPQVSLSTNFNDAGGEHGGGDNSFVQTNILQGKMRYRLADVENLEKYDIYYNNQDIYSWLKLDKNDVLLDLYGFHNMYKGQRYILSIRRLKMKVIKSFALYMRPIEVNVKENIAGEGIYLYDTESKLGSPVEGNVAPIIVSYYLKGFNNRLLFRHALVSVCKYLRKHFWL